MHPYLMACPRVLLKNLLDGHMKLSILLFWTTKESTSTAGHTCVSERPRHPHHSQRHTIYEWCMNGFEGHSEL